MKPKMTSISENSAASIFRVGELSEKNRTEIWERDD
jgi:hypothetical protein